MHGGLRDLHSLGHLGISQTREEVELDYLALALVNLSNADSA
jgi:hypothetical protein